MFSSLHFRLWRRIPNPHDGQQPISGWPNESEGITAWTPLIVALPHQPGSGLGERPETRRLLEWLGINIVDLWPPESVRIRDGRTPTWVPYTTIIRTAKPNSLHSSSPPSSLTKVSESVTKLALYKYLY